MLGQRFWSKVEKTETCWNWTGGLSDGYGKFWLQGGPRLAHRLSYQSRFGCIDPAIQVLHECDNRKCVNPNHLFLGTNTDNVVDRVAKKRSATGERAGRAKLTDAQVAEIRASWPGVTQRALAIKFGVLERHIWGILHNETRKHHDS